ncbi:LysR family transcriptional regulator [Massilia arenosa]|uniref:LysR family transcriptional regulator n=1 Tax=Zemynaea arenosa TaxID=2561931 RepID=A0A4Y9RRS7_9BURK|nr:LysR family transcriptional regulator [Massilia arenosa]TFW11612.1 LysR family transcriptional regulator [Massilia arenosa]
MFNLNRFQYYAAIVDCGSLTRAAEQLAVTKAMLSFQLKQLEAELGVALLTRTTRKLVPTEAGLRFYHDCQSVLQQAQAAVDGARSRHSTLSGRLRVTSTAEYGDHVVVPALADFARLHPELEVSFFAASAPADLVAERFDLAIRLGTLADSSYRATQLGRFEPVAVAAPSYLGGTLPATPEQLAQLDGIFHERFLGPLAWTERTTGTVHLVEQRRGRMLADHARGMLAFVRAGGGVAVLPEWLVADALARGELVRLLPGYTLPPQGIHAVYPDTRHVPAKVALFIAWMKERLGA